MFTMLLETGWRLWAYRLALKSIQFDEVIQDLLKRAQYVELSGHEDFTLDFAMNMMFGPIEL